MSKSLTAAAIVTIIMTQPVRAALLVQHMSSTPANWLCGMLSAPPGTLGPAGGYSFSLFDIDQDGSFDVKGEVWGEWLDGSGGFTLNSRIRPYVGDVGIYGFAAEGWGYAYNLGSLSSIGPQIRGGFGAAIYDLNDYTSDGVNDTTDQFNIVAGYIGLVLRKPDGDHYAYMAVEPSGPANSLYVREIGYETEPDVPLPEPTSLAFLGTAGLLILGRRLRS